MTPISFIASSQFSYLSMDCLIADTAIVQMLPSIRFFKAFAFAFVPIFAVIVLFLAWKLITMCLGKDSQYLIGNYIMSYIVFYFLIYPTLVTLSFNLFNCRELDTDKFLMLIDLSIPCWDNAHTTWAFMLGLPMVLVWVVGLPLFAFNVLRKYKDDLELETVIRMYKMLY